MLVIVVLKIYFSKIAVGSDRDTCGYETQQPFFYINFTNVFFFAKP